MESGVVRSTITRDKNLSEVIQDNKSLVDAFNEFHSRSPLSLDRPTSYKELENASVVILLLVVC